MPIDNTITGAMFIIAFLAFGGAFKAIYAGWTVREMSPFSRRVVTQRRRYTFLALGQGILAACAAWLFSLGSISDIIAGAKEWFAVGVLGWIIGLSLAFIVASPLISVLALISIYRHPAMMAYKRFGRNEYCTTQSHRAGTREFVQATTCSTGYGTQRVFVSV